MSLYRISHIVTWYCRWMYSSLDVVVASYMYTLSVIDDTTQICEFIWHCMAEALSHRESDGGMMREKESGTRSNVEMKNQINTHACRLTKHYHHIYRVRDFLSSYIQSRIIRNIDVNLCLLILDPFRKLEMNSNNNAIFAILDSGCKMFHSLLVFFFLSSTNLQPL